MFKDGTCKAEIRIGITIATPVMAKGSWSGVEEQHRLPRQAQLIQIYGALHYDIWMRGMNTGGKYRIANPGV